MGGRGGSSGMGGDSGKPVQILGMEDVWSYRHDPDNAEFVDAINEGARKIQEDFGDLMSETVTVINAAQLDGMDKIQTLGFYSRFDKSVSLNDNYVDVDKMNRVYDRSVESGYHPPRGNLTGTEAVALHELGHALTDHVAMKMGVRDLDDAARRIFEAAYKATKGRGPYKEWAGKISGYAQEHYAEAVAEAVADYYCNGSGAHANSRAIMAELFKYR